MAKTTKKATDRPQRSALPARKAAPAKSPAAGDRSAKPAVIAAPVLPIKGKRNAGLANAELKHFRQLLLAKRATLMGDVTSMANEALGKNRQESSGDLSNMPIHMADIGSDNYEQEFTLGLLESEQALLREIDSALNRMDQGIYGVCLGTGKPINKARLEAKPWARYSIEYARQVEKGLAPDVASEEPGPGSQA